jgi:thioester reductase-like protein
LEKGYFFTGFPGFICNQLIREVMRQHYEQGIIYVLVLPAMVEKAEQERENIISELGIKEDHFRIIEGDITKEGLSISNEDQSELFEKITHVYHLLQFMILPCRMILPIR